MYLEPFVLIENIVPPLPPPKYVKIVGNTYGEKIVIKNLKTWF